MKTVEIQAALAALGYKPGPLDGIWGKQSVAALRLFQAANGLNPDGIIGPLSLAALFPNKPLAEGLDQEGLVWFKEARRLIGTREKPGTGSNPEILDWANNLKLDYKGDDIPWCGLFVGHCISATLDQEPTPTRILSARAWQSFGIKTAPTPGAVMVFWRKSEASGLGHVGFYAGEDKTAFRILGGNQSDKVSLAWIDKKRLVAARWPASVPPPIPKDVQVARDESLSWDES